MRGERGGDRGGRGHIGWSRKRGGTPIAGHAEGGSCQKWRVARRAWSRVAVVVQGIPVEERTTP